MALILRLAWRNVWRHRRRSYITASAIAVGLALCFATIALQDGMFAQMFNALVRRQIGDVQIHAPGFPKRRALEKTIPRGDAVLGAVTQLPSVAAATGRVYGFGLLGIGDEAAGAQLVGIDPAREDMLTELSERIITGRALVPKGRGCVLLGAGLAKRLGAKVGDEVVVVTQAADGSLGNELYEVRGVFRTGAAALDRSGAYLALEDAQELLALGDALHEVAVLAADPTEVKVLTEELKRALTDDRVLVRAWDEVNPQLAQLLGLRDIAAWLVAGIIFGVAALGVLNTMLMSVFERTRELGVLLALGFGPQRVLALVLAESVLLSLLGIVLGSLLGGALDLYLVVFGVDLGGGADLDFLGVAFDPVIHAVVTPASVLVPLAMVLTVSLLAAVWPAVRAARLEPVRAMRQT